MRNQEETKHKVSAWRIADILLCLVTIFISATFSLSSYISVFSPLWILGHLMLFLCIFCKKIYYKDVPSKKTAKIIKSTVRIILYTAVITVMTIPFTMHNPWKWYYPVQRGFFLTGYSRPCSLDYFLPECIPDKADGYEVHFIPKVLQGSAGVHIKFFTDKTAIEDLRRRAVNNNAEYLDISAYYHDCKKYENHQVSEEYMKKYPFDCRKCSNIILQDNASPDGAEAYAFSKGYYILNENTGYVNICR